MVSLYVHGAFGADEQFRVAPMEDTLMMNRILLSAVAALTIVAAPAVAQDSSAFNQCQSCHTVTAPNGNVIAGRGRTGPDLYGVVGRAAGSKAGFGYGEGILAAGAAGLVWTEANIAQYVANPTEFLRNFTGDSSVRSRMSYRARSGQAEVAAFLARAR